MGKKYNYDCDICGKTQGKYFTNHRRYTVMVKGVKVTIGISTSNLDDLCDDCFDALVKSIGVSDNFKSGRVK